MLTYDRHGQANTARAPMRGAAALARFAPLLPALAYLVVAPALGGAFRLDVFLAIGAAGLLAVAAVHFVLKGLLQPFREATELLETRLDLRPPPGSKPKSEAEKLTFAAELAADRIDALTARIERCALADELTGLPNRRAVLPQLKGALARARRAGEPFALALVDLDGLKHVNEVLGVEFGDAVLRNFADILRTELRASDVAARWSGADFLLLLPLTPVDAAVGVVDRLRLRLLDRPLAVVDGEFVSVTAGVSGFQITDLHVEEIIKRADEALEAAKRAGRNRVMALDLERFHEL